MPDDYEPDFNIHAGRNVMLRDVHVSISRHEEMSDENKVCFPPLPTPLLNSSQLLLHGDMRMLMLDHGGKRVKEKLFAAQADARLPPTITGDARTSAVSAIAAAVR